MDHQEIIPKRKRADTITQVADESHENLQNEGVPNVNHEWEEDEWEEDDLTFLYRCQMMIVVTKTWK
jgi:hypothetical protein